MSRVDHKPAPDSGAATSKKQSSPASETDVDEVEAFGQMGVRRFVRPILLLIVTVTACISACLWYRSERFVDSVSAFPLAGYGWELNSVWGRMRLYRLPDTRDDDPRPKAIRWSYSTEVFEPPTVDPWDESWRKAVGLEWRSETIPTGRRRSIANVLTNQGWWLRIRWQTITLVLAAWPIASVITHHWRRRRR